MQGPELPIAVNRHAMINIGIDKTVVIGGETGSYSSAQTFSYHHNYGNWSYGPSLILGRGLSFCPLGTRNRARAKNGIGKWKGRETSDTLPKLNGRGGIRMLCVRGL